MGSPNFVCFLTSLHDFTINVFFCPQMQFLLFHPAYKQYNWSFQDPLCHSTPKSNTTKSLQAFPGNRFILFCLFSLLWSFHFHTQYVIPTLFSLLFLFTKEMKLEATLLRLNVIYYSKLWVAIPFIGWG